MTDPAWIGYAAWTFVIALSWGITIGGFFGLRHWMNTDTTSRTFGQDISLYFTSMIALCFGAALSIILPVCAAITYWPDNWPTPT